MLSSNKINKTTDEEEKKPKITTACFILEEMLKNPPKKVICTRVPMPRGGVISECKLVTDNKAIADVKDACNKDLVVSPFSNDRNLIFTTREKYEMESKKFKESEQLKEQKTKNWFPNW